jgi:hypothetical protein
VVLYLLPSKLHLAMMYDHKQLFYGQSNLNMKNCFRNEKLNYRLFVIDYAWPSIHSALKAFNDEDVIQYASHILAVETRNNNKQD